MYSVFGSIPLGYSITIKLSQLCVLITIMIYCSKNTRQIDDDLKILQELRYSINIIIIFMIFTFILAIILYLDVTFFDLIMKPQYIFSLLALSTVFWSYTMVVVLCYFPLRCISIEGIKRNSKRDQILRSMMKIESRPKLTAKATNISQKQKQKQQQQVTKLQSVNNINGQKNDGEQQIQSE